jgi:hypothetical protein
MKITINHRGSEVESGRTVEVITLIVAGDNGATGRAYVIRL